MGIPTLISTATASDATSVDITSGIDSTYDEYMFVCTDIHARTDGAEFGFQANVASASGFNETITSTFFNAFHQENDGEASLDYVASFDQAQGTDYQEFMANLGSGADESGAGILHLFNPSSTVYVKHFYGRNNSFNYNGDRQYDTFVAGYFNVTGAIDEVSFKMSSGNMDGVIQMYGIK